MVKVCYFHIFSFFIDNSWSDWMFKPLRPCQMRIFTFRIHSFLLKDTFKYFQFNINTVLTCCMSFKRVIYIYISLYWPWWGQNPVIVLWEDPFLSCCSLLLLICQKQYEASAIWLSQIEWVYSSWYLCAGLLTTKITITYPSPARKQCLWKDKDIFSYRSSFRATFLCN